ncbi:MAG: DUF1080 domain-containing protein, partial [Phycisphaerales bacterium]
MVCKFLTVTCSVLLISSGGLAPAFGDDDVNGNLIEARSLRLFNGKDLTGWDGDRAFWSVRDGFIVGRVSPEVHVRNHSYLIWQGGKVRDFELRLMVRSTQGNSGIDYRAEPVRRDKTGNELKWTIEGYQSDIAKGWMGSLYNWARQGAQPSQFMVVTGGEPVNKYVGSVVDKEILYGVNYYEPGVWNQFTIIARGSHILHRINGYPVVECIDNSRDARRQGIFGLQVHAGRGPLLNEFKDICIRQFNINFRQAKLLFNGKNLSGWTFSNADSKDAWAVENEVLVNKGLSSGYICTEHDYASYVLRFQYRRLGEAKGGVLLRISGSGRHILIEGEGDDFNQVTPVGDFTLQKQKHQGEKLAFR